MTSVYRMLTVALCVAILASTASAASYGYLSDSEQASGTLTAANSFNGNGGNNGGGNGNGGGNSGGTAYNDANNNGQYDRGETTYTQSELITFDNQTTNLVIPESVGTIDAGNQEVDITAGKITSNVDIVSKTRDVTLTATSGGIDLGDKGVTISQGSGTVDISAAGDVDLSSSTITTNTGSVRIETSGALNVDDSTIRVDGGNGVVDLDASRISARNTVVETNTGDISISATRSGGGELDATTASMSVSGGGNGGVTLESVGDTYLDEATLTSSNGQATADLGVDSATIHVENIAVDDKDGSLTYSPANVTEDPDRADVSN